VKLFFFVSLAVADASLMSSYSDSSQNVSLILLHWAVIMGRVSTEPGN